MEGESGRALRWGERKKKRTAITVRGRRHITIDLMWVVIDIHDRLLEWFSVLSQIAIVCYVHDPIFVSVPKTSDTISEMRGSRTVTERSFTVIAHYIKHV